MENIEIFEIIKIIHILAIISWMAGLLYLPRIFVYHTKVKAKSEADQLFQIMEKKLFYFIMTPALIVVLISGLYLASIIGFEFVWLHIKISVVFLLIFYHHFLLKCYKNFVKEQNKYSEKFYRIINEIPAILMIIIITLVILKPFS